MSSSRENDKFKEIVRESKSANLETCTRSLRFFLKVDTKRYPEITGYILQIFSRLYDLFNDESCSMKDITLTLSDIAKSELNLDERLPDHKHRKLSSLVHILMLECDNKVKQHPKSLQLINIIQILNSLSKFNLDWNKCLHKKSSITCMQFLTSMLDSLDTLLDMQPLIFKASEMKVILMSLMHVRESIIEKMYTNSDDFMNHRCFSKLLQLSRQPGLYTTDADKEDVAMIMHYLRKICLQHPSTLVNINIYDQSNPFIALPYIYLNSSRENISTYTMKNLVMMVDDLFALSFKDTESGRVIVQKFMTLACNKLAVLDVSQFSLQSSSMLLHALSKSVFTDNMPLIMAHLQYIYNNLSILKRSTNQTNLHFIISAIGYLNLPLNTIIHEESETTIKYLFGDLLTYYFDNIEYFDKLQAKHYAHLLIAITKYSFSDLDSCLRTQDLKLNDFLAALLMMIKNKTSTSMNPVALLNGLEYLYKTYNLHYLGEYCWKYQYVTLWSVVTKCLDRLGDLALPLKSNQLCAVMSSLIKLRVDLDRLHNPGYLFQQISDNLKYQYVDPAEFVEILKFISISTYDTNNAKVHELLDTLLSTLHESYSAFNDPLKVQILSALTSLEIIRGVKGDKLRNTISCVLSDLCSRNLAIDLSTGVTELYRLEVFYPSAKFNISNKNRNESRAEAEDSTSSSISEGWVQYALKTLYSEFTFVNNYYCSKTNREIDFALVVDGTKIAIEVDGYDHLVADTNAETVKTCIRNHALTQGGWLVVIIPIWQTDRHHQVEFIRQCLGEKLSPLLPLRARYNLLNDTAFKRPRLFDHGTGHQSEVVQAYDYSSFGKRT